MIRYDRPADVSAFEAISAAQKLAFAPIAFQASVALERLGILQAVADTKEHGATAGEIAERLSLPVYGVRVLLDMGLSIGLVWQRAERYVLDKVGHFWLNDAMTRVNADFVTDVCYDAMSSLQASVEQQAPRGLARFGSWPTLYPGLTRLPAHVRSSWLKFDHFYSSSAFAPALSHVFKARPRRLLDVGGNTGLWATACVEHDADVEVTIVDLPEQARLTSERFRDGPHAERVRVVALDLLDPNAALPQGADVVWMSQLLDCFSEEQAARVLRLAADAMSADSSLFVLETLCDRQKFDAATYSVNATSLYFTCIANGVSRMFRSEDLLRLVHEAGLTVTAEHDHIGRGHTLLHCRKAG
ncbi:MAG TPA: methyltransferase [Gammaproteobacteria bacterium]|nr:methyltransferase [Gammaproteobacteria bacterium]